ncbi:MAG: serine/threonine-protein phosphatase, partial [Spirochaetaceae bacterium]|nr:serine/threonine-protein phosphatase [Spirochaetaceae bacterium]
RFAAFSLCIFDSETGVVRFCNAGDNLIRYFDASEQKLRSITLPQTPAAGVLPNDLVMLKGGYQIHSFTLDHGDILLLYTDGIEEAKRKFRNRNFAEIICEHDGAPQDTPHGNHVVGQDNEELGADRVEAIINAVMRHERYELFKYHNPRGNITYHFDFTECEGTVEDLIMAMVSVEKIFRMWKNDSDHSGRKILVDKKVDSFLRRHFVEYSIYCGETAEYSENPAYLYYLNVREDEQYDDLTILGIKHR